MRNQRSFSLEFKREVVEELMSGETRPAQLCRQHDMVPSLLYHWKRQYSRGKFNNKPTEGGALRDRVEKLERLVGKFTLENELLKRGLAAQPQPVSEKRQIIRVWGCLRVAVQWGCQVMKLSRSSFYHKLKDRSQVEMQREADLRGKIRAICFEYPRYGYRRVTEQLKRERLRVNHKKVLRLMSESDMLCRIRRRRVKTTDSRHRFRRYPNLIKGMAITRLNQVWLSDITYTVCGQALVTRLRS